MRAKALWWGTLAVGGASAGALAGAAFAPLLMRAVPDATAQFDLVCLFLPTSSDWAAHLMSYAILLLLVGSLGLGALRFVEQTVRTRRTVRRLLAFSQPVDAGLALLLGRLGLTGRIDLVQTPLPIAFCYGLRRPRICLSSGMVTALDAEQLTALLWHEQAHLLQRDPLKVAVGRAWTAMFFFLPLARTLYSGYLLAKEIEADAYACTRCGGNGPLTAALARLLDVQDARGLVVPQAAGGTDALEMRVDSLLGHAPVFRIPPQILFLSSAVLVGLVGLELILTQAGVSNALWNLSHSALGGC